MNHNAIIMQFQWWWKQYLIGHIIILQDINHSRENSSSSSKIIW